MRILVIALLLSGCGLNSAYLDQRHDEKISRYSVSCEKLGYAKGSKENADCSVRMFQAQEPVRVQKD